MSPTARRPRRLIWVMAAIVLASCTQGSTVSLPQAPPTVRIGMVEYQFQNPPVFPRGRVMIEAHNDGHIPHRFVIAPLEAGFPPVAEQIRGNDRRFINPLVGIPDQQPGQYALVAADLPPGRYGFFCFYIDPDGKSHSSKGMGSEFTVR